MTRANVTGMAAPDPIPIADDVCEILFQGDAKAQVSQLAALVRSAAGAVDGLLAEVEGRGGMDRLLPDSPAPENAALLDALTDGLAGADGVTRLARAFIRRGGDYDRVGLNRLLARAEDLKVVAPALSSLIAAGLYDRLISVLTGDGTSDSPALRALAAARPDYEVARLNAPALQRLAASGSAQTPYDLIIVPGFTPVDAARPVPLDQLPAALARLALAISDFNAGCAPLFFLTGSAVHPPGTPFNEALMMRDHLVKSGIAPDRIVIDPFARHSTTNLRNAGRFLLSRKLRRAIIATGKDRPAFDQAFYFGHPTLSSFSDRCQEELGYLVGSLDEIEHNRIVFSPAPEVMRPDYRDPLDY